MRPSRTRRSLLAACGTASALALAGCSEFFNSKELAHEVEPLNLRDTAHTLTVSVKNNRDTVIYNREFKLGPEKAEEDTEPFTGTPDTITLEVDGGSPKTYPWPEPNCEGRSAGGARITMTAETILVEPSCNTVYAE